jgi:adenylate cyclase
LPLFNWTHAEIVPISAWGARRSIVAGMSGQPLLRLFLPRVVRAFLAGALYAGTRYGSPVSGGLAGALCAASFISLEAFVLRRNSGAFIRPLPFLAYFALRSVLYVGVIIVVIVVVNVAAGGGFAGVRAFDLIFALVGTVGVMLFLSVNDLLGPAVLFAFAAGRYHNPRIEERALLFIDMRASTAIAERLGELSYLKLLNRFVGDVSCAVAEAGGGIHKYVGDEVIATWRLAPGANPPKCVRAAFAVFDRIAAQGPAYEREFGVVPDFRARPALWPDRGRRARILEERDRAHRRHDEHGLPYFGGLPRHRQSGARLCGSA